MQGVVVFAECCFDQPTLTIYGYNVTGVFSLIGIAMKISDAKSPFDLKIGSIQFDASGGKGNKNEQTSPNKTTLKLPTFLTCP